MSNLTKNQLSNGEINCGSVIIDDNNSSSNSNNTSIEQYISMIHDEMDNSLKQSKFYVGVIELDTQSTTTANLTTVHDRLKKLKKTLTQRQIMRKS